MTYRDLNDPKKFEGAVLLGLLPGTGIEVWKNERVMILYARTDEIMALIADEDGRLGLRWPGDDEGEPRTPEEEAEWTSIVGQIFDYETEEHRREQEEEGMKQQGAGGRNSE